MYGDAMDIKRVGGTWDFTEWTYLKNAARSAGATFNESYADDPSHVHVDTRPL